MKRAQNFDSKSHVKKQSLTFRTWIRRKLLKYLFLETPCMIFKFFSKHEQLKLVKQLVLRTKLNKTTQKDRMCYYHYFLQICLDLLSRREAFTTVPQGGNFSLGPSSAAAGYSLIEPDIAASFYSYSARRQPAVVEGYLSKPPPTHPAQPNDGI